MKNKKTWQEIKDELFKKYQLPPEAVDRSEKYPLAYPFAKAVFECTEHGYMEDFIAEGGNVFYLPDPSEIKKQLGENEFVICDRAYSHIPMGSIVKVNPDKRPRVGFALIEFAGEVTIAYLHPRPGNIVRLVFNEMYEDIFLPKDAFKVLGKPIGYRMPGETEVTPVDTVL